MGYSGVILKGGKRCIIVGHCNWAESIEQSNSGWPSWHLAVLLLAVTVFQVEQAQRDCSSHRNVFLSVPTTAPSVNMTCPVDAGGVIANTSELFLWKWLRLRSNSIEDPITNRTTLGIVALKSSHLFFLLHTFWVFFPPSVRAWSICLLDASGVQKQWSVSGSVLQCCRQWKLSL